MSPRKAFLADEVKPHLKQPQLTAPDAQTSLIHREKPQDRVGVEKNKVKRWRMRFLVNLINHKEVRKTTLVKFPDSLLEDWEEREAAVSNPVHLIYHHSKS